MNEANNTDLSHTAIVLTAHPKQQKWWASVLVALEGYPGPMILAYDDMDLAMIPREILTRFNHAEASGYSAGQLGHGRGELVCLKMGFAAACQMNTEYCLKLGFDEPPWRWRNLRILIEELKEQQIDCIDCETRIIFGRSHLLLAAMNIGDVVARGPGAAENYWNTSTSNAGLRRKRIDDRTYWEHLLGLIHIQGEYAANLGMTNKWSWTIGELWPRSK